MTETLLPLPALPALPATPEGIAPYGTLVMPSEDGTPFGPADATLGLMAGTPRLYIMRLNHCPPAGPRHHAAQPRHAVPCRARQEGVVHLPRPPANPMRRRSPTPPPSGAFASAAAWRWR